jgi:hypothetical protein
METFGAIAILCLVFFVGMFIGACFNEEVKPFFLRSTKRWKRTLNIAFICVMCFLLYYKAFPPKEVMVATYTGVIKDVTALKNGDKYATVDFDYDAWDDFTIRQYTGSMKPGGKVKVKITEER